MEIDKCPKAVVNNMPELPYAIEEAINRLRVNISFLGSDIKKIMIISTTPDEGKSFVAMQLWRQMASTNISAVLLDMDLRKSVMADKYEVVREDGEKILGTSDYLANDISLDEVVLRTDIGKGALVPNVNNVVNPSLLLEGKKFGKTLAELSEAYRYVIVDSPPLDLVSDGERIGSLCDGAILVTRGGTTPKKMVKNSIRQLERAGCPLLGIVLNRVKGSGSGSYYKQYGGKYGYYGKNGAHHQLV